MKTVLSTFVLGLVASVLGSPAWAQPPDIKKLAADVATLQGQVTTLQGQNSTLQGQISALQTTISSANAQNAFALGQFVTIDTTDTINGLAAPHIIFTGANLHVRDGSGSTDDGGGTLTGLGNLVIGYDDAPELPPAAGYRSGVHNLVVGTGHTFNSFGGFVAGDNNSVEGPHASVSGGRFSTASGLDSSVSGGLQNLAADEATSVSGGHENTATQFGSSVSGGNGNTANGATASVSGGTGNQATADSASISGGESNVASDIDASVSGGLMNQATASDATVGGGDGLINSTPNTFVP